MKIENRLIVRRLIAGIILLILSIFELIESYHVAIFGQVVKNNEFNSEAGVGLIIGTITFVVSLVFIFTSKTRPKKWLETTLAIMTALGFLSVMITSHNDFPDLPVFAWSNLVITCIAFPWSKKGYKGMSYVSKTEKTTVEENNTTEENNTAPRERAVSNELRINVPDEISKYKKLLDDGTITQEEFDAKKKQLLGL